MCISSMEIQFYSLTYQLMYFLICHEMPSHLDHHPNSEIHHSLTGLSGIAAQTTVQRVCRAYQSASVEVFLECCDLFIGLLLFDFKRLYASPQAVEFPIFVGELFILVEEGLLGSFMSVTHFEHSILWMLFSIHILARSNYNYACDYITSNFMNVRIT